jgi:glycosyltransferase involved in cell wall biosynthesis
MRSLHVVTSDARRGAETFALGLAEHLESPGHLARVVALAPSRDERRVDAPTLGTSRRSPRALSALRRAARTADVVVAHGSATLEACAVALSGTHVPFVYRSIGHPEHWVQGPVRRSGVGAMLRRAARVTALWPEAADVIAAIHRVPRERIDVIPNGVLEARFPFAEDSERASLRASLGVAVEEVCLSYVGALTEEKRPDVAIDAVATLPGATLLVVGAGGLEAELRRLAERVAPSRVQFLGQLDDPRVAYAAADLLLLPSRSEGMPAVPIEAGLVGTATVATPVGALPSVIEDGATGFLSATSDPSSFVRRVSEALSTSGRVGSDAEASFRGRYAMVEIARLWSRTLERALAA